MNVTRRLARHGAFFAATLLAASACRSSTGPGGISSISLRGPGGERVINVVRGGSVGLVAQAMDASGRIIGGAEFGFTTRNPTVASVDASGRVTALAAGTTLIVAQATNGASKPTDSVAVTVGVLISAGVIP